MSSCPSEPNNQQAHRYKESKVKSRLMRAAKFCLKRNQLDKVVCNAAFSPPSPSYRFIATNSRKETNIRLNKHADIAEVLSSRGYRARGSMIPTPHHGKVAMVYLVPKHTKLSDCDDVILYSHGSSIDIGLGLNTGYRVLNKLRDPDHPRCTGLVLWDYQGYGLTTVKEPTEQGIKVGITSVYDHIVSKFNVKGENIIAMGQSIGSVPTIHLASLWQSRHLSKVVLVSPISSAFHVFSKSSAETDDPVGCLNNVNVLKETGCPWPVLIFHGENDTFVPIKHGQAIMAALRKSPSEANGPLVKTASEVAIKNIESLQRHSSESCPLWRTALDNDNDSDKDRAPFSNEPCDSTSLSGVPPEVLYKERIVFCPVPNAGHNDIMNQEVIYEMLGSLMTY